MPGTMKQYRPYEILQPNAILEGIKSSDSFIVMVCEICEPRMNDSIHQAMDEVKKDYFKIIIIPSMLDQTELIAFGFPICCVCQKSPAKTSIMMFTFKTEEQLVYWLSHPINAAIMDEILLDLERLVEDV